MSNIIGHKDTMALEYFIIDEKLFMGYARLWFNGDFLGTMEDVIYFDGYIIGGLLDLLNKKELSDRYFSDEYITTFKLLEADLLSDNDESTDVGELSQCFSVHMGTLLDDFTVFSYKIDDEKGVILWEISSIDENIPFNDLKHYPRKIFTKEFNYNDVRWIIRNLYLIKYELESVSSHGNTTYLGD